MAGYIPFATLRPILHRGPVPMPVVDRRLVFKPVRAECATLIQIDQMIALREEGVSCPAIGKKLGFAATTIRRHTKHVTPPAEGWSAGGRPGRFNKAFAQRLHRAGFTYSEIASEVGCSKQTASNLVKGHRAPHPKSGRFVRRPTIHLERVVSTAVGVTVQHLRRTEPYSGPVGINKARMIMQWLVRHKKPDLHFTQIGKYLGGYDGSTCSDAFHRVNAVAAALNLKTTGKTQHVVERLYAADWSEVPR